MAVPTSAQRDRVRKTAPALVGYTETLIYGDVWEREALSKRDRSLVTISALIAAYRPEQLSVHLGRALDNGLTKEEIAEAITHLAFYAGWPSAMTAADVFTKVLEARGA